MIFYDIIVEYYYIVNCTCSLKLFPNVIFLNLIVSIFSFSQTKKTLRYKHILETIQFENIFVSLHWPMDTAWRI